MASSSHPHPDHERERFPVAWEDDDAPGLSVHPLTRADAEAILASLPDEPDDTPPLRLPPRNAPPPPGALSGGPTAPSALRLRPSTSAAARPSTPPGHAPGPCALPPPRWPGLAACCWRPWRACPCPPACWPPSR